jgi:hypothetical protein
MFDCAPSHTRQDHEFTRLFIIKAVFAFACKGLGSEQCNILSDVSADVLIGEYTYAEGY